MTNLASMQDLYLDELKDLYSAETQILNALPKMAQKASHPQLRQAFELHQQQTEHQVRRLEQIFDKLGESPKGKVCKAMQGLIAEGQEVLSEQGDPSVLDAAMIGAAQRIEHYEMAGYGTARTIAQQIGDQDAVRLLEETLNEEKQTDEKLTQIAESVVNKDAMKAGA